MAVRWRRRKQLSFAAVWVIIWCAGLTYIFSNIDEGLSPFSIAPLESDELLRLMTEDEVSNGYHSPLEKIILPRQKMYHFYHLPKRKTYSYSELTSANRDTGYPLAPDFTFHVRYMSDRVVVYEDSGPGCIYRIFLYPVLPTNTEKLHRMTSKDLHDMLLLLTVDGQDFFFTLRQFMEAEDWPFLYPLSTRHSRPASGMSAYTPICYQQSMSVSYVHHNVFPENLFNITINCTLHDFMCPVHVYSAVSRHKFPPQTKVASLNEVADKLSMSTDFLGEAAVMFSAPEKHGPDRGHSCNLRCVELCSNCKHNLVSLDAAGVITSIKLRVFEKSSGKPVQDWNGMNLIGHFDRAEVPQVSVPLGSLVGAAGALNDFIGAAAGMRKRKCTCEGSFYDLPVKSPTGHIYYPMPFWKHARLSVEGTGHLSKTLLLCYQVTVEENYYNEETTAYFHATKSYYSDDVRGYRDILKLQNSWGHIVGLYFDVDNLKALRHASVSERWAALQADIMVFTDDSMSAVAMGTGLEDYFSYAHGFALAENTTYSFVGVYFSSPRRREPLTWYCYRQHVLDPIPFQTAVHMYSEGTSQDNFYVPVMPISSADHRRRLDNGLPSLSHTVIYYAKYSSGLVEVDSIVMGLLESETDHELTIETSRHSVETFTVSGRHYLGASFTNASTTRIVRAFSKGDRFQFKLTYPYPNQGLILRRDFYSRVGVWNEKSDVIINGELSTQWVIPMGSLNEAYSLRQDDLYLGSMSSSDHSSGQLSVQIIPLTTWHDCSYHLFVIV